MYIYSHWEKVLSCVSDMHSVVVTEHSTISEISVNGNDLSKKHHWALNITGCAQKRKLQERRLAAELRMVHACTNNFDILPENKNTWIINGHTVYINTFTRPSIKCLRFSLMSFLFFLSLTFIHTFVSVLMPRSAKNILFLKTPTDFREFWGLLDRAVRLTSFAWLNLGGICVINLTTHSLRPIYPLFCFPLLVDRTAQTMGALTQACTGRKVLIKMTLGPASFSRPSV